MDVDKWLECFHMFMTQRRMYYDPRRGIQMKSNRYNDPKELVTGDHAFDVTNGAIDPSLGTWMKSQEDFVVEILADTNGGDLRRSARQAKK